MKSTRAGTVQQKPSRVIEESSVAHRLQRHGSTSLIAGLGQHFRAGLFGLGELARTPLASLMTILVIGIAMAFPAGLYVLLCNFAAISEQWHSKPTISLYLQPQISSDQLSSLMTLLKQRSEVETIQYISPAQGLKQFIAETKLSDAFGVLPNNPLPGVIVITPKLQFQTRTALKNLLTQVQTLTGVDVGHLDMAWIQRLHDLVVLGKRITYSLGILLGLGVTLIVGNTIRLATQNRRQEIGVMQLIGATNAFIRRPFLYRGLLYGFFGGVIAWILVLILVMCLQHPAEQLAPHYMKSLWSWQRNTDVGIVILIVSTLLSLLGSWLVVSHYLRRRLDL